MLSLIPPFVTFCLFPKLRSLPGLNSMGLFASLFAVQFLFIIQFTGEMTGNCNIEGFCVTIGILLHIGWLSFFTWTFICSLHMFFVFVYSDYRSNDANRLTEFKRYVVCSVLFPVIIVVVHITLTTAITEGDYIGYGGTRCFVSNTVGIVLSFIVPVGVICIINTVFFVMAIRKISNSTNLNTNQKDQTHHFRAFSKLFVVTGATWILQIIDGFLPLSPFSYIVTLCNGSQGLIIFVLFVCNSAVFEMYRNFHKRRAQRRPSQAHSTTIRRHYKNISKSQSSSVKNSNNTVTSDDYQSHDNLAYGGNNSLSVDDGHSLSESEPYSATQWHEQSEPNGTLPFENDVNNPDTNSVHSQSCDSIDEDENIDVKVIDTSGIEISILNQ